MFVTKTNFKNSPLVRETALVKEIITAVYFLMK